MFIVVGGEVFRFHGSNSLNRERLLVLRENLRIGNSYSHVLEATWGQLQGSELRLSPDSDKCWMVSMPPEVTTTDWRLYIGFSDKKVAGFVVRTSDGPPPNDGPLDVGDSKICGF